ncbi:hypothetical protein OCU04_003347 [Sclerotinia nivalis]|uniref:Uncharacterized protein n=1 Tax=Sclerotinia nivalis TaxID=352851 RepID=A0A9X0DP70_9HELO|nr:hypothetical protein OCU04_003347 [Sclerotinia nivalis]
MPNSGIQPPTRYLESDGPPMIYLLESQKLLIPVLFTRNSPIFRFFGRRIEEEKYEFTYLLYLEACAWIYCSLATLLLLSVVMVGGENALIWLLEKRNMGL